MRPRTFRTTVSSMTFIEEASKEFNMEPGKMWIRCMGGKRCNHAPGTCTASPEYTTACAAREKSAEPPEDGLPTQGTK